MVLRRHPNYELYGKLYRECLNFALIVTIPNTFMILVDYVLDTTLLKHPFLAIWLLYIVQVLLYIVQVLLYIVQVLLYIFQVLLFSMNLLPFLFKSHLRLPFLELLSLNSLILIWLFDLVHLLLLSINLLPLILYS